jgi:alpha-D-ribose 1-methylphosphonate 5-triphosphate synthase subunit PhnH
MTGVSTALEGGFANAPVEASLAFRAALEAMARPGQIMTLSGACAPAPASPAAAALLLTLCDPETPLHLAPSYDTAALRDWVAFHIGAPIVGPETAQFALGDWASLMPLDRYAAGTPEYPDRSATLIVEVAELTATGARLTGPGIADATQLSVPEVAAFRANRALFPLGLDFFLICGSRVAALPRTTDVEAG